MENKTYNDYFEIDECKAGGQLTLKSENESYARMFVMIGFLMLSLIIFELLSRIIFYKNSFNKSFTSSLESADTHSEEFASWTDEIIMIKSASPTAASDLYFNYQTAIDQIKKLNFYSNNNDISMEPYTAASTTLDDLMNRSLNTGRTVALSNQDIEKLKKMKKPFQTLAETINNVLKKKKVSKNGDDTLILKNNDWDKILKEIEKKTEM